MTDITATESECPPNFEDPAQVGEIWNAQMIHTIVDNLHEHQGFSWQTPHKDFALMLRKIGRTVFEDRVQASLSQVVTAFSSQFFDIKNYRDRGEPILEIYLNYFSSKERQNSFDTENRSRFGQVGRSLIGNVLRTMYKKYPPVES